MYLEIELEYTVVASLSHQTHHVNFAYRKKAFKNTDNINHETELKRHMHLFIWCHNANIIVLDHLNG